jgi:hypothetical protein
VDLCDIALDYHSPVEKSKGREQTFAEHPVTGNGKGLSTS